MCPELENQTADRCEGSGTVEAAGGERERGLAKNLAGLPTHDVTGKAWWARENGRMAFFLGRSPSMIIAIIVVTFMLGLAMKQVDNWPPQPF